MGCTFVNILMIAEKLTPAIGGVEKHVHRISECLTEKGHAVTCVAPAHTRDLPETESVSGYRILRIPASGRRKHDYINAWRWWRNRSPLITSSDIIHFHDVYALIHWFGPMHISLRKRKAFITYHGYGMEYPIRWRDQAYRRISSYLTGNSLCIGDYLVKWFDIKAPWISYGGVDAPDSTGHEPVENHLVFIGRLARDTAFDMILDGIHEAQKTGNKTYTLTVCGDGVLREEMMKKARQLSIKATFCGFVNDPGPYMEQAEIVFAPGYLTLLEAFIRKRPVINVYRGHIRHDYYGMMDPDAALFLHTDSYKTLARMLLEHMRDEHRLNKAYRFAKALSWDSLTETYLRIWGQG